MGQQHRRYIRSVASDTSYDEETEASETVTIAAEMDRDVADAFEELAHDHGYSDTAMLQKCIIAGINQIPDTEAEQRSDTMRHR